ncbi:MAG: glucosaminidase domain-containing protein [Hyphomicrobiaceae bacterium]|nr:glucosaminidase domain-containing protein [Hyphomicrobiaceae bacterium]
MLHRVAAVLALALFGSASPAATADLPAIIATQTNRVPACATPGRLMAYLERRNPSVDARYADLAVHYMRHGEDLGLRWDIGFFQMLVETANLRYTGDVDADQNNFAGLGATGNGAKGERFADVATGVRAHLEHIKMYSGQRVENPVAERTRNVQAWGVLTKWQKGFKRPITFADLTSKWSPGDRGYARDIAKIAEIFYKDVCDRPDPRPELLAAAKGDTRRPTVEASTPSSAELVAAAVARAKAENGDRNALGAGTVASETAARKPEAASAAPQKPAETPKLTIINAEKPADVPPAGAAASADVRQPESKKPGTEQQLALVGDEAKRASVAEKPAAVDPSKPGSCKVWTASYGGTKAIIIKALTNGVVNYTVLDVNVGREQREADAYIAAYAKGGTKVADFESPSAALDKAFQLCPEG